MSSDKWSEWFIQHLGGTGIRYKVKPKNNQVYGGAGSVSQMLSKLKKTDYQIRRIKNVQVIRFTKQYLKKNSLIEITALTHAEHEEIERRQLMIPGQQSLEDEF